MEIFRRRRLFKVCMSMYTNIEIDDNDEDRVERKDLTIDGHSLIVLNLCRKFRRR